MNTWAMEVLATLEAKRDELQRQLTGIQAAIQAIRNGYELPELKLPSIFDGAIDLVSETTVKAQHR